MGRITIGIGLALIALGGGFYVGTGMKSITAMIPAFIGLPVAVLGGFGLSENENVRKHTAHVAVMLTLLGALAGLGRGIPGLFKEDSNKTAVMATLIMAAICILHVILSVRSFIAVRKAREAEAAGGAAEE